MSLLGAEVDTSNNDLVVEHLDVVQQVVNQVASRYPAHVDRQELWNAGACGLVEAARRYRPETGVPFARFAALRIRGSIIDSARARDPLARPARRKVRELREAEDALQGSTGRAATDEDLTTLLGISREELESRRGSEAAATSLSLDAPETEDGFSSDGWIPESDPACLPEESLQHRELIGSLREAVRFLPPVQREVVERYYFAGEMLQDIADSMAVTEARVSQICTEAVNAMRAFLGTLYDGVPEVAGQAPGKRNRAEFLDTMSARSTWRTRLDAAGEPGLEAGMGVA